MHVFKDRKEINAEIQMFLYREVSNNLVAGFHSVDSQYVPCSFTKALVLLVCEHQVGIRR